MTKAANMQQSLFHPAAHRFGRGGQFALWALACGAACLFNTALHAQLPTTQMTSLSPPGGKVGTTVDVTITGVDLDDADRVLFSHPGITAAAKIADANEFVKTPKPVPGAFQIKIAADVPPGIYEARIVSRYGVSNPRAFAVGTVDEVVKIAGNNVPEKAQELPLGPILNGRADPNTRDYYKFTLQAGQRVLMECVAKPLDSRMDATLALFGPDGKEVARDRKSVV